MDQRKRKLATAVLAAASLAALATPAHAIIYAEGPADAGQTLATARNTGTNNTTALTAITGSFASSADADLYRITITAMSTFSATTVNATSLSQDTALFLFSSTGVPIATNDDANGTTFNSTLGANNALYATLAIGTYYLAISESGNEPVNSAGQLLFAAYPAGDTTATRGRASGLNPTTLSNFNSNQYDNTTFGNYEIDLTSVATAVPEPRTWTALGLGTIAAAFAFLRRRRQA